MGRKDETYEGLRARIISLPAEPDIRSRTLTWVTGDRYLAVSRNPDGRVEVFVAGDPLRATTTAVGEVLEHDRWAAEGGEEIAASRVVLPLGAHFDQFAALLCVELVDHDVAGDHHAAFAAVEPLIELALTREHATDLTLMGLTGELALLRQLLEEVSAGVRYDVLSSWAGSEPSSRDFQIDRVGVEVKTTQGASSIHKVSGVHQVELGRSNGGVAETHLFMLSLGIRWVADDEGESLPELVDDVLALVPDDEDRKALLARIKQYGGDSAIGYDHARDRRKLRYSSRFTFRFERLYDMTDDNLKLLTSTQLVGLTNVDPGSVEFRVQLEERVRGDLNPVTGWPGVASTVLQAAGLR